MHPPARRGPRRRRPRTAGSPRRKSLSWFGETQKSPHIYTVRTDADGRFKLRREASATRASVAVAAHGFLSRDATEIRIGTTNLHYTLGQPRRRCEPALTAPRPIVRASSSWSPAMEKPGRQQPAQDTRNDRGWSVNFRRRACWRRGATLRQQHRGLPRGPLLHRSAEPRNALKSADATRAIGPARSEARKADSLTCNAWEPQSRGARPTPRVRRGVSPMGRLKPQTPSAPPASPAPSGARTRPYPVRSHRPGGMRIRARRVRQ